MNPYQSILAFSHLILRSIALLISCLSFNAAASTEFQLLQSLGKQDGRPYGKLINDSAGSFYGTTYYGGSYGSGTVFKLGPSGDLSILHEFDGNNGGSNPYAGLIQGRDGGFYGTTENGGANDAGTVFKLEPSGNFIVLHEFDGGSGGANPYADLIQGNDGSFYGTTLYGGGNGYGTIFKIDASGNFSVLHEFDGDSGGAYPYAELVQGIDGNFYGTTSAGGGSSYSFGTVFKLDASGNFTILHSFDGFGGSYPYGGLMQSSDGSLYGTTSGGGGNGAGTVYKLDQSGNFGLVHEFAVDSDGWYPYAGLLQGSDGSLYGTTVYGGANRQGTIFKLATTGEFNALYSFDTTTGANPYAGLIQGPDGSFFGATFGGGVYGYGMVFKLDSSGNVYVLSSFGNSADIGAFPVAGLIESSDGSFYGTNSGGGIHGYGTLFKLDSTGENINVLYSFDGTTGRTPNALTQGADGNFYGTTYSGGNQDAGTVFKLEISGNFSVLHNFDGDSGGSKPYAELMQSNDGSFYGTTYSGGSKGYGTVFKLDPAGNFSIVHDFAGGSDGWGPYAGLTQGTDGSFYGTTRNGGGGHGTVFKLDASGNFAILHLFDGDDDGGSPTARLIQGRDGSFYGTTYYNGGYGAGTLFKLDVSGNYDVLHDFDGGSGGASPYAGLIQVSDGSFYGTTLFGGSDNAGTVYKLDPFGQFSVQHSFDWDNGGRFPQAGLMQSSDGSFYGAAQAGGKYGGGVIYRLVETPAITTTTLSSDSTPSFFGQTVIFTATVSGNNPGGTVEFIDGTISLGFGTISNGVAVLSTSGLSVGSHSITASYSGDADNTASISSAISQVVNAVVANKTVTKTELASSFSQALSGRPVVFTATVQGRKPTGAIVFYDGTRRLGTSLLDKASKAKYSTSSLGRGTHRVIAHYQGDSLNAASDSPVLIQVVR